MPASSILWATLGALVIAAILARSTILRKKHPLPPGPPGDPIIGHVRSMPPQYSWLYYTKLWKQYGDVISLSALGMPIIVLNTVKAANDLMGKRSTYNDRPFFPMATQLMGMGKGIVFANGTPWKNQRRMFQSYLNKTAIRKYWGILERETRSYPLRVLDGEDTPLEGLRLTAVKIICEVAYGLKVESMEDPIVKSTVEGNEIITGNATPGRFLVDVFPSMLLIPDWFPGTGWKQQGKEWGKMVRNMYLRPYEKVRKDEAEGIAPPSFALDLMRGETAMDEDTKIYASGTMYVAGADTIIAMTKYFVLAMTMYPEAQRKAQDEIDRVVGTHRLPGVEDQPNLPYIEALLKELYRWASVAPLAVPHRAGEDDVYEGRRIPKGAMIVCNVWGMAMDEDIYTNPAEFIPERFIQSEFSTEELPMDPRAYVFGIGRRICPGLHFAELAVFMTVVSTLATVNISKSLDAKSHEIPVEVKRSGTPVSVPLDFECRFEPRSAEAVTLARDATS